MEIRDELVNYAFRSNPRLKRPRINIGFTADQAVEFARCQADPIYFIEKYVKIIDRGREVFFKLFDYQKEFVTLMHKNRFITAKMARQMGKSTSVAAFFCWYLIFHDKQTCAILANKASTSKEILMRVQYAYERLPLWLQQGVTSWNKGSFSLENESRIVAAATSSSAIRGMTINFLFIDEVAHIAKGQWEQFYESVYSTISSDPESKIVLVSTPKGMNHFYAIHTKAERGLSSFKALNVTWRSHPRRDEAWKLETISNTSIRSFEQEHEVAFLGSALTLISSGALTNLVFVNPEKTTQDGRFKIFTSPEQDHTYLLSADVAQGTMNDYSTFSLIDISVEPFRQVATFRDNTIDPESFADVIYSAAKGYNNAWVLVETNDVGGQTAKHLWADLGYENMLHTRDDSDPKRSQGKSKIGLRVDKRTKKLGCIKFKQMIENSQLQVVDNDTIGEMFMFVRNPRKVEEVYSAQEGSHDDMVMPLVNFSYFTTTRQWGGMDGKDIRKFLEAKRQEFVDGLQMPMPAMTPVPVQQPERVIYTRGRAPVLIGKLDELEASEKADFLR